MAARVTQGGVKEVELLVCPYNKSHTVARHKYQHHLILCRKSHPAEAKNFKTCIYNNAHQIPQLEMEYHEATCTSKTDVLARVKKPTQEGNRYPAAVPNNLMNDEVDWEQQTANQPKLNILQKVAKDAQEKSILINHMNQSKAKKREKRTYDSERMSKALESEEAERKALEEKMKAKKGNTYDSSDDDDSELVEAARRLELLK